MSWIIYAVLAAVLWGASYVMYGVIMKSLSVAGTLLFTTVGSVFVFTLISHARGDLLRDWSVLKSGTAVWQLLAGIIIVNALANWCLLFSMKESNPTLAGLIEISYPFFTALFAYLFLKEAHLTIGTAVGGALILSGVAVVYYFSKTA